MHLVANTKNGIILVLVSLGKAYFITCKSFNVCEKNANVLVPMNVDFVELVRLKVSHSFFLFNVFDHLFSYEIWQHYIERKKSEITYILKFIEDVPIKILLKFWQKSIDKVDQFLFPILKMFHFS